MREQNEPTADTVVFEWCADRQLTDELSSFFVENVDPCYISHGEIQGGRACDGSHWATDLASVMKVELTKTLDGITGHRRILMARIEGKLAGLALIRFEATGKNPYAVLDDVIVARSLRGSGIGSRIVDIVEAESRRLGCRRLFLESGKENRRAHDFFRRLGYESCSVVLTKAL